METMNTKMMRLPPRRNLDSNKRKDREDPSYKSSVPPPPPMLATVKPVVKSETSLVGLEKLSEPVGCSNQLLAGYLAHEFLTKGTLFGQPWNPAGAESETSPKEKRVKPPSGKGETELKIDIEDKGKRRERYMEVSKLLKMEGPHLPGIINPTQLAHFLQL